MLGGRYRVLDRIGAGGMADVVRARDELLSRDVAIKVFRTIETSADSAERQRIELEALAQLNHPNLITLYDGSLGADGPSYLVMELIDGPSLASRVGEGPLPEPEVRLIGAQIADALAYVHAADMVHRDVKPENILLGSDGGAGASFRARLSDFGIVRLLGESQLTRADLTIGTASYLAPEQARGSQVGPAADLYALGLVLLECLTGHRAFTGPPVEVLAARLASAPDVPADLPGEWPGLLRAMTAIDPAARPTALQVARTLAEGDTSATTVIAPVIAAPPPVVASAPAATSVATPTPEVVALAGTPLAQQDGSRRRTMAWIAGAAAIVLILAGIILAIAAPDLTGGSGSGVPSDTSTASVPRTSPKSTKQSGTSTEASTSQSSSRSSSQSSSQSSSVSTSSSSSASTSASSSTSTSTSSSPPPSSSSSTSGSSSSSASTSPANAGGSVVPPTTSPVASASG